jgi:prepilin-type N-terminal cleavage/methylation domain-containing protein
MDKIIKINFFNKRPFSQKNGFTLLELLLVLALMAALAVVAAPMYLSLQAENEMNITTVTIGDILRRAQLKSQAIDSDSAWGVEIKSGTLTIFKGQNFANRDQTFDENFSLASTITLSGLTEIIFYPLSGAPNVNGIIKLEHLDGRQSQLSINGLGIINTP